MESGNTASPYCRIIEFNEDEEEDSHEGVSAALDPTLYSMLKDLRKKMSSRLKLPPYVIFQDISLEQMATVYPVSLEDLQTIQGVGAGKARRYGKEFVALIKKHCEENDIERPMDLRVMTLPKPRDLNLMNSLTRLRQ